MQDGDQATPGSAAVRKRAGFVQLDRNVLTPEFPRVGSIGIAVFLAIASHASGAGNTCWASYDTISQEAQCCRDKAIQSVKALIAAGVLSPIRRKGPRGQDAANGYEILKFGSRPQRLPNPFKESSTTTPRSRPQRLPTRTQGVAHNDSEVESLIQVESIEGEAPSGALPAQPPLSLITVETTPQTRSVANSAPARVMQQIENLNGAEIVNRARAAKAIAEMLKRGYTEQEIFACYRHQREQRKKGGYTLWYLADDIDSIIGKVRQKTAGPAAIVARYAERLRAENPDKYA